MCRLRSFSTVLANASALAATACCLRRTLSFSTTEPHSVVAAARCFSSACLLFTFSIDFAHALCAAGRPLCGSMTGALRRNDDRQVRDGHPRAIERQTLGRVSAGRTPEGVPLNAAYRRPIGANIGQAHLSAACQTLHSCPRHPLLTEPPGGQKCAHSSMGCTCAVAVENCADEARNQSVRI